MILFRNKEFSKRESIISIVKSVCPIIIPKCKEEINGDMPNINTLKTLFRNWKTNIANEIYNIEKDNVENYIIMNDIINGIQIYQIELDEEKITINVEPNKRLFDTFPPYQFWSLEFSKTGKFLGITSGD